MIIGEKVATDSLKYRIGKFKNINLRRNFMDPGCTYFRLASPFFSSNSFQRAESKNARFYVRASFEPPVKFFS